MPLVEWKRPVEDYRTCAECGEKLPIGDFYTSSKYYKSCNACRKLRRQESRKREPKTPRILPTCTRCGSPPSLRQLNASSKELLLRHRGEMLCESCFIGEDEPLKLEDFMRSGTDVWEGATPMSTGGFTHGEQKKLRSYNHRLKRPRVENVAR